MTTRATARVAARVPARGSARTARPQATPRPATPRPELRLVPGMAGARPRRRPVSLLRHRRAPFVLLVVALLVGTTLGLLVLNTAIAVDSLKATHLRADNAARSEELQRLQRQVVSAARPPRSPARRWRPASCRRGTGGAPRRPARRHLGAARHARAGAGRAGGAEGGN